MYYSNILAYLYYKIENEHNTPILCSKTPKDPHTQSNTITVKTTQHTTQQSINKNENYITIPQPSNPLTLSKQFH